MQNEKSVLTIQSRPRLEPEDVQAFDLFAERYGRDQRRLNALLNDGAEINDVKKLFIKEGLTARQFNAMAILLKGALASRAACVALEVADKKRKIVAIENRLKKTSTKGGYTPFVAHQKKRRIGTLKTAIGRLERRTPRMIFGSKKLWNAQHSLAQNGYANHAEWLADWREARSNEFFLVGSKDERLGNQSCQWDPVTKRLAVRLPDALGGRVVIENVRFPRGEERIIDAILRGSAVSYRFVRKEKGWYVFASVETSVLPLVTDLARGAVGIDVGSGLIAVVETDAIGNPVWRKTIPLPLQKKTTDQAKALIQEAVLDAVSHAKRVGKPISIETLDFTTKKATLRERGVGYARMLSGFAYGAMHQALRSRAAKDGVGVIEVNAAYSSTIGIVKWSAMYGLSGDEAAALTLARRAMRLKESVPARTAFDRPEDRSKHVWSCWNRIGKALRPMGRHAFVAAKRGLGGGPRVYPVLPARAAPA